MELWEGADVQMPARIREEMPFNKYLNISRILQFTM